MSTPDRSVLGVTPARESRSDRRERARIVAELLDVDDVIIDDVRNALSRTSRPGLLTFSPGAWWNPTRVGQPAHRAVSGVLASAHPFLAADAPPMLGPVIGVEERSGGELIGFDPWAWYEAGLVGSPNCLVMGALRQGKSWWIKSLLTRLLPFGRQAINVSDSKGEHGRIAEAVGGTVVRLGNFGSPLRINALDAGHRKGGLADVEYASHTRARQSATLLSIVDLLQPTSSPSTPEEVSALDWALEREIVETDNRPTIRGIRDRLLHVKESDVGYYSGLAEAARRIPHALRPLIDGDLAGMFEDHSTIDLDVNSPYTVFDTEAIAARGDTALALAQIVTNAWVYSAIADKASGRKFFLIREEGWRDMSSVAALNSQRLQLKLSGEYGITMVMLVHEGGDFDTVGPEGSAERSLARNLLKGYENVVSFRQGPGALRDSKAAVGFSDVDAATIARLEKGQYLLRVKDRSYVVDAKPISSAWERELFNTDGAMALSGLDGAVICETCGSGLDLAWNFCISCGQPVAAKGLK